MDEKRKWKIGDEVWAAKLDWYGKVAATAVRVKQVRKDGKLMLEKGIDAIGYRKLVADDEVFASPREAFVAYAEEQEAYAASLRNSAETHDEIARKAREEVRMQDARGTR